MEIIENTLWRKVNVSIPKISYINSIYKPPAASIARHIMSADCDLATALCSMS